MGGGQVKDGEPNKRKWTAEITRTIDTDEYDKTGVGPYEHAVLALTKQRHCVCSLPVPQYIISAPLEE